MNAKYHSYHRYHYGFYGTIRLLFFMMRSTKLNVSEKVIPHEIQPNIRNQFLSKLLHTRELYKHGPYNCKSNVIS